MKKYCIINKGVDKVGKTQTIKEVIRLLKNKNCAVLDDDKELGEERCVLQYRDHVVACITYGDTKEYFIDDLKEVLKFNPNVVVCASRTKGNTVDVISQELKGYTKISYSNFYSPDNSAVFIKTIKESSALSIIQLIDKLIQ